MKNIFSFLVVLAFICTSAFGQAPSVTMTTVGSPVTNTGVLTSTKAISDTYREITIQMVITKTSGTLAGTVTVQGSLDAVNYFTIPTASTVAGASTYTVTDVASQSAVFIVKNSPASSLRLSWTGTGTMVGTAVSYILPRK